MNNIYLNVYDRVSTPLKQTEWFYVCYENNWVWSKHVDLAFDSIFPIRIKDEQKSESSLCHSDSPKRGYFLDFFKAKNPSLL